MAEKLRANILADLAYYRRSRLLLAFLLAFLVLTALSSLPAIFSGSGVQSFNTLRLIFSELNIYLLLFAGGFGVFIISSHIRNRSLKMVFTKPCSPALWLASALISAVAVSLFLNAVVLGSAVLLSLIWHVPVRVGLLYVTVDTIAASVGIIAYLMLLATLVHPAIAVVLGLLSDVSMFYSAHVWALSAIRAGNKSHALQAIERFFQFLYLLVPMWHPFGKETDPVYTSMRVVHGDWKYLLYSFGYAFALAAFCYFTALFALQKRRLI